MAKQVITITMEDKGGVGLQYPVSVSTNFLIEDEHGSMSCITAMAFRKCFPEMMKQVNEDIAATMSDVIQNMEPDNVH
ncbi:hypothetical protein JFA41_003878 [Salmonella enterica subsp. enterica serovar Poona]|nr:hypothetical protein [Salmonella enterica subsp. enterica serovar Poona]ELM0493108.1 hypothetical protein [Salmonella enterica]